MSNVTPINPVKPLEDWQQRVVVELDELNQKIHKLAQHYSDNQAGMKKHVRHPLMSQINAMCTYADVLQLRISMFNVELTDEEIDNFEYPLTSVAEMGNFIAAWHDKVMHDINHLQNVPEGASISVAEVDDADPTDPAKSTETPPVVLSGDSWLAFKAGAKWAGGIAATLPFQKTEVPITVEVVTEVVQPESTPVV